MSDPVSAADGNTYEQRAISRWFQTHSTSPLSGQPLASKELKPHVTLRNAIREWKEQQIQNSFPNSQLSLPSGSGSGSSAAASTSTSAALYGGQPTPTTILSTISALSPKQSQSQVSVAGKPAAAAAAGATPATEKTAAKEKEESSASGSATPNTKSEKAAGATKSVISPKTAPEKGKSPKEQQNGKKKGK
jgi:hypothetical protein